MERGRGGWLNIITGLYSEQQSQNQLTEFNLQGYRILKIQIFNCTENNHHHYHFSPDVKFQGIMQSSKNRTSKLNHNPNAPHHPHPEHIAWDEATIQQHNKVRGTYTIINEPKTPYRKSISVHIPFSQYYQCLIGVSSNNKSEEQDAANQLDSEEQREIEEGLRRAKQNAAKNQSKKRDLKALNEQIIKEYQQAGHMDIEDQQEDAATRAKTIITINHECDGILEQKFKKMRDKHYGNEFNRAQNLKSPWEDD